MIQKIEGADYAVKFLCDVVGTYTTGNNIKQDYQEEPIVHADKTAF